MMKKIILLALALFTFFSSAQSHDHHSGHTKTEKKEINGNKFHSPSDLKIRMEKIVSLMKELQVKKNDKKIVVEYSGKIKDTVNDIFKTCKLDSAADEAVHPVLGQILDGAEELSKGNFQLGYKKIHEAHLIYESLFEL